jgi:hypothetical protein
MKWLTAAVLPWALVLAGCSASDPTRASPAPSVTTVFSTANRTVEQQTIGRATRCIVNGELGPPSFLVSDLGKAGVPRLKTGQAAMARSIAQYVRSRRLRFLVFKNGEFIVFDALDGPCEPDAPGYPVLNEGCNAAYSPTDNFDHAGAYANCYPSPRPWLTGAY